VPGSANLVPPPAARFDSAQADVGMIDSRVTLPLLTAAQLELLHATHLAHRAVSDWKCGTGSAPVGDPVHAAHLAFEASAIDAQQSHFFRMKDFDGLNDGYSAADMCRWARLQDARHERWMRAVEARDWFAARVLADTPHHLAHLCANLRDPNLLVQFAVEGVAPGSWTIQNCPAVLAGLGG
jgi:hypothetical protein